jgi:hypothetical protein
VQLQGAKALTGSGIKRWSTGELSIVDRPCLPSATFVLRRRERAQVSGTVVPWYWLVIIRELAGPTVQAPEYKKPAHDTTVVAGFTSCSPQSG